MKRLDLIDEGAGESTLTSEAGMQLTSTTPSLVSTSVEPLPTFAPVERDAAGLESATSPPFGDDSDEGPGPGYPCPPSKPYRLMNGACAECNGPGFGQCGPGYSCEIGPYKCEPLCTNDRDCMFRQEQPWPVCDDEYLFCRGCRGSFECSPGLMCLYFQCVPPPQPEPTSTPHESSSVLDAAVDSSLSNDF